MQTAEVESSRQIFCNIWGIGMERQGAGGSDEHDAFDNHMEEFRDERVEDGLTNNVDTEEEIIEIEEFQATHSPGSESVENGHQIAEFQATHSPGESREEILRRHEALQERLSAV